MTSYVVNFHTQMRSSQSEERTMFSHVKKKKDTSNQNRKRHFFMSEKNDTSNQKPKGVWVSRQNSCLLHAQASQDLVHIQRENLYVEAMKQSSTRRKVESDKWNKCREPAKQQQKGKNRRRSKPARARVDITFYLCLQLCLRPCTDYVCTLYTILSLLYLLLLDSFFNEKKYLIPFKSIIPNTSKWLRT